MCGEPSGCGEPASVCGECGSVCVEHVAALKKYDEGGDRSGGECGI